MWAVGSNSKSELEVEAGGGEGRGGELSGERREC